MPCRQDPTPEEIKADLDKEKAKWDFLEASLCATLIALQKQLTINEDEDTIEVTLNEIDFKEAGITKNKLKIWWKGHCKKDKKRKEEESKTSSLIEQIKKLSKSEIEKIKNEIN